MDKKLPTLLSGKCKLKAQWDTTIIPLERLKWKELRKSIDEAVEKLKILTLLQGMVQPIRELLGIPTKAKLTNTLWPSNSTSGHIPKEVSAYMHQRYAQVCS